MTVLYRDEMGLVAVEIDTAYLVTFGGGFAFFEGLDGKSYRVPVDRLSAIGIPSDVL